MSGCCAARNDQPRFGVVSRLLGARGVVSGDVDQGREMTVPVTEFEVLDPACSCGHRIVESGRSEFRERPVAVLL